MSVLLAIICKLVKAGQTSKRLVAYVAKKSVALRADLGFGEFKLSDSMLTWAAETLRAHRDSCRRASEVRHVIFSAQKGQSRRAAYTSLHAVCKDWLDTYAAGQPWVAALQNHNGVYHLHLAVSNVNDSGRPLKIRPYQAIEMSEMKFTDHAISAKGKGKKGLPIYTKARGKLAVQDLAELLVDPAGGIRSSVWQQLKNKGLISSFRQRKDGSIISFSYQGRRMRMRTLEGFVARLPASDSSSNSSSGGTAPAPKQAVQPLPDSIAAKLSAAGFSGKDLAALKNNLRASKPIQPRRTKPKPININIPKI